MRISVIGTGYLGAVHAACIAHLGHEVCAYDTDASKIAMLSAGTSPFYEPGFEDLLTAVLATARPRLTHDAEEAISGATVHFVCVGTPQLPGSNATDVQYVDNAVNTIAAHSDCPGLIVGKSTVPVGTAQRLVRELANAKAMFPTLTYCESAEEACRNVDLIELATEWDKYGRIDPAQLREIVRASRLLDTRNAIDREYWTNAGWQVNALGRGRLTRDFGDIAFKAAASAPRRTEAANASA